MLESTIIIAFDQHAATTVAAVLLPQHRTPALHSLTSDISTIQRFVARVKRQGAVRCWLRVAARPHGASDPL